MTNPATDRTPSSKRILPLLSAARGGDARALGQLLNAYRPFLLAVATAQFDSNLKAKAGPSDVVQETFVDAQRHFPNFKSGTEAQFRIWLYTLLMNNLADLRKRYLRTAKRQVRRERPLNASDSKRLLHSLADADGRSPSNAAISREEHARINAALERLTPTYRQIIILRSKERRSFAHIARLIGKSPDAARMLWQRAIARLRRELGDPDASA